MALVTNSDPRVSGDDVVLYGKDGRPVVVYPSHLERKKHLGSIDAIYQDMPSKSLFIGVFSPPSFLCNPQN